MPCVAVTCINNKQITALVYRLTWSFVSVTNQPAFPKYDCVLLAWLKTDEASIKDGKSIRRSAVLNPLDFETVSDYDYI